MAINKKNILAKESGEFTHLKNGYNSTNRHNHSHNVNLPTNFNLKEITLEDIDKAVFMEFDKRFLIRDKIMPLIILDADIASLHNQNYVQLELNKNLLSGPFFTFFRISDEKIRKTNPSFKPVIYTIPKQKPNGIVYEEYITEGPVERILHYEFKFITSYRELANQMDEHFARYFKNKRNMILCNSERFVIAPESSNQIGELEMINRDDMALRTLYQTTYKAKIWCFTRSLDNMQKRERPNTFSLNITTTDSINDTTDSSVIDIKKYDINLGKFPGHP